MSECLHPAHSRTFHLEIPISEVALHSLYCTVIVQHLNDAIRIVQRNGPPGLVAFTAFDFCHGVPFKVYQRGSGPTDTYSLRAKGHEFSVTVSSAFTRQAGVAQSSSLSLEPKISMVGEDHVMPHQSTDFDVGGRATGMPLFSYCCLCDRIALIRL